MLDILSYAITAILVLLYNSEAWTITSRDESRSIFWDIKLCSPLKVNRRFGGQCSLYLQGRRISQGRNQSESRCDSCFLLGFSSTLKMEAICSSETSVEFQQTTRRYFPEDITLHNYCCENLKSYRDESRLGAAEDVQGKIITKLKILETN
jgi:hypothetical protein